MKPTRSKSLRIVIRGAAIAAATTAALDVAHAEERLVVWWDKGYYEAENVALKELIDKFERRSGIKVELQQYPQTEHIKKLKIALEAQLLPDIAFSNESP